MNLGYEAGIIFRYKKTKFENFMKVYLKTTNGTTGKAKPPSMKIFVRKKNISAGMC
jgi:hypothetical protein